MRPQRFRRYPHVISPRILASFLVVSAAQVLTAAGCSSMPWDESSDSSRAYSPSYAAASSTPVNAQASPIAARRYSVIIAPFTNPTSSPVTTSSIGPGMAEAVRAQLAKDRQLEPQVDAALGREVADALALPQTQRERRLWQIWNAHPKIDWVLTGLVRQFTHLAQSPDDLSAWGPSRNRMQASVKVSMTLIDLQRGSVITSDELSAVAWADEKPAQEIYKGLKFGSHQFWQTPLGLASREVVDRIAAGVVHSVPATTTIASPIRVIEQIDSRRVRLTDNAREHASEGDVLYVCIYAADGLTLKTVDDPVIHQPIMARIEPYRRGENPTARLTGEKPDSLALRGAVLTRERPVRQTSSKVTSASRSR